MIFLEETALYQNLLITGTIGTGKTSSAMYPFTEQLISYKNKDPSQKLGMLILDVKGNYCHQVIQYCQKYQRQQDLVIISFKNETYYNPLDKPDLKPSVLANRLKEILLLFSKNNSESYWLDKVEQILCEAIKLCRLYLDGYVTFEEIHKLISVPEYYQEKLHLLKDKFIHDAFSKKEVFDLLTSLEFFEKEFFSLDQRTLSILKSEITRITNYFVSDYDIAKTFCPPKQNLTFHGFKDVIREGKIVVLDMNISEYKNISKLIAAYLKLDFQSEVLAQLSCASVSRTVAFISDEYSEYATTSDANFFSQSREAKCINIVATQSYTSLLHSLSNEFSVKLILQNLVNKLWFRTDDIFTIELAQKQIGKEEKERISKSISENAKETNYNYITKHFDSQSSNISESFNVFSQLDFIYDYHFFTQELKNFECLAFLSSSSSLMKTYSLKMIPYFFKKGL